MEDLISLIQKSLTKIWSNRRWVAATTLLCCAVGWTGMLFIDDQYVSTARVIVDSKTMLSRSLEGLAVDSEEAQGELLNVARSQLLTRDTIDKIIRANDLDHEVFDEEDMMDLRGSVIGRTTIRTDSTDTTNRRSPDDIIEIEYVSSDPNVAHMSVSTYLNILLEKVLGASQRGTEATERFLVGKVEEYRKALESSETTLKEFKRRNIGLVPGEGENYFRRVEQLRKELRDSQLEEAELNRQREELTRQIRGISNSEARGENLGMLSSPRNEKVAELEARLLDLLLVYTDEHPDVVALKNTIAGLKRSGRGKLTGQEQLDVASLSGNRVVEELRVELGKSEGSLAAAQARVTEYQRRLSELEQAINTIPEVEAEFTRLTRDYSTNKQRYDELLDRLQSARLSKARDRSEGEVSFNVIEPPQVPVVPSKPNRLLLASIVLLGSIAAGLGMGLLVELLRPTFSDAKELDDAFGLPVLGSVHHFGGVEAIRGNLTTYAGLFAALIGAYVIYLIAVA
ncbi:MAG: XrtA system polysaccharide chain length determinant [Pseudomonadales bacterium]